MSNSIPSDITPRILRGSRFTTNSACRADNLLRIGAFCFHSGDDGAFVIAKAHPQLEQLVGVRHVVDREDRSHANVNLIQYFKRNCGLDGSRRHSQKITTEDTEDTEENRLDFLRVLSVLRG